MGGLTQLAWRSLRARPIRTALTAIAVALGITVILGVQIATAALKDQAVTAQQYRAGSSDLDVRVATGTGLSYTQVGTLAGLQGVSKASPLLEKRDVAYTSVKDAHGMTVTLVGVDSGQSALRPLRLVSGRLPDPGALNEIVVDEGLAAALGRQSGTHVSTGSTLLLTTNAAPQAFTIVGLSTGTSGGAAFTNSAVFVNQEVMVTAFSDGLRIPLVALQLTPSANSATVAGEVRDRLGSAATTVDPRSSDNGPLTQLGPLLLLMTALSLIIGAGVTANSISLSVMERRREISLLRAGGASGSQVFRLFFAEAALVAVLGAPVGIGAGILLGAVLVHMLAAPDLPTPALALTWIGVIGATLIGLISAVLGSVVPASFAARTAILAGLRPSAGDREQTPWKLVALSPVLAVLAIICFVSGDTSAVSVGAALLLAAVACALPIVVPLLVRRLGAGLAPALRQSPVAAANLVRRRNRTTLTAAGLCLAVAAAVATSSLAAGATDASDQWISRLFVGDAVVKSPIPQSDAIAEAVAEDLKNDTTGTSHSLSGHVHRVIPIRVLPEPVAGDVLGIAVVPFGKPPANSSSASYLDGYPVSGGLDILDGRHDAAIQALTTGNSVLIPETLASDNAWAVGTTISIEGQNGQLVNFRVAGIVAHSYPAGDGRECIVMDTAIADRTFGVQKVGGATTSPYTASGFDLLDVQTDGNLTAVSSIASRYGLQTIPVTTLQESARAALNHSIGLLEAVAIIAVGIAMLAVINTLIVNVRMGTRDLALLRAVGLSRRSALQLLLCEAALLAVTATVIGILTGAVLALPMLVASGTVGFTPQYNFPLATALVVAITVVVATVVATLAPARRAASGNIVSNIRYE